MSDKNIPEDWLPEDEYEDVGDDPNYDDYAIDYMEYDAYKYGYELGEDYDAFIEDLEDESEWDGLPD